MTLNGGDKPAGIYGYVDMYTWEGWLEMYIFGWFVYIFNRGFKTLLKRLYFIALYFMNPQMPLCFPGENLPIFFGNINGCSFVDNNFFNFRERIEKFWDNIFIDLTADIEYVYSFDEESIF